MKKINRRLCTNYCGLPLIPSSSGAKWSYGHLDNAGCPFFQSSQWSLSCHNISRRREKNGRDGFILCPFACSHEQQKL